MLPKCYRLKNNKAFTATYSQRNICASDKICVYFGKKKTNPDNKTLFAFVVSKKIHKRAVVRNRIKRLMRENIRLILKENPGYMSEYMSVIFVAKQGAIGASFEEIRKTIREKIISKINRIKQSASG